MMKRLLAWTLMVLALVACGGSETSPTAAGSGDASPANGAELYQRRALGSNPGCITCHSLEPEVVLVGPSLASIGTVAAERVPATAAADYLRESITDPGAFIVDGFNPGTMPANWQKHLTDDEIEALVEYLLTLGAR